MKGKHKIVVSTKRLKYEFELHRNLTIIRGDSATGKTTLVDMIRDHINNPSGTPVELVCDIAPGKVLISLIRIPSSFDRKKSILDKSRTSNLQKLF